jgi:hypothetical protein
LVDFFVAAAIVLLSRRRQPTQGPPRAKLFLEATYLDLFVEHFDNDRNGRKKQAGKGTTATVSRPLDRDSSSLSREETKRRG